jgi:hypothetical protein
MRSNLSIHPSNDKLFLTFFNKLLYFIQSPSLILKKCLLIKFCFELVIILKLVITEIMPEGKHMSLSIKDFNFLNG